MFMRTLPRLCCPALLLGALAAAGMAQIKTLSLAEMVQTADQAVHGQIVASRVTRRDTKDLEGLYFTTLTIQGRTLRNGQPITVDVTFRGGFVNETEGVFNSEAPAADDVKVGKRVVAFYRWADDMGGGMTGNMLVGGHGGIYRVVEGARGPAVLGRGEGYAIRHNQRIDQLESAVRLLKR